MGLKTRKVVRKPKTEPYVKNVTKFCQMIQTLIRRLSMLGMFAAPVMKVLDHIERNHSSDRRHSSNEFIDPHFQIKNILAASNPFQKLRRDYF